MSILQVSTVRNAASSVNSIQLQADGSVVYGGVITFASGQTFPSTPSPTPPPSPTTGSTYFDTSTTPGVFKVYNGSAFVPVSSSPAGAAAPASPQTGTTWYNTASAPPALNVWSGSAWSPIGAGTGTVTAVSGTLPISVATGTTTPVISIAAASTSASGAVQLNDTVASTSTTLAATANSVKTAYDAAISKVATVTGTAPVTITGTATAPVISVSAASTSASGIVQLNDTVTSTSTTTALTAAQGKVLQTQIDALIISNNLTLGGTIDGSTGLVATVTTEGTGAGLTVGAVLPAASSTNKEYFVIVTTAGTMTPPGGSPTVTSVGSWFLSTGTAWSYLNIAPTQYWSSTGTTLYPATTTNNVVIPGAGTTGSPAVSFSGSAPAGSLTVSNSGVLSIGSTGVLASPTVYSSASPTMSFNDGTNNAYVGLIGVENRLLNLSGTGTTLIQSTQDIVNTVVGSFPWIVKTGNTERLRVESGGNVQIAGAGTNPGTPAISFSGSAPAGSVTVDSAGNVGIGTTTPGSPLDVFGGAISSTDSAGNARSRLEVFTNGQTSNQVTLGQGLAGPTDNVGYLYNRANADLVFGTNDAERMRIDSAGNVGIGTTAPAYQLELSTDSAGKPATNTWTVSSDERIKEDIQLADLDQCYDAIKAIPLKRYKWRDEVYSEEQVADRHKLGWIAQDVETVFPKAVGQRELRYNQKYEETVIAAIPEELDKDGNVITAAQPERIEKTLISEDVLPDCRSLNSDQIYAAMFGTIQKLIAKVETLEATVASFTK